MPLVVSGPVHRIYKDSGELEFKDVFDERVGASECSQVNKPVRVQT